MRKPLTTCVVLLACLPAAPAIAGTTLKKAIWGPPHHGSRSFFPTYEELGVGIYQIDLHWDEVARRKPRDAGDPRDAAYRWRTGIDYAVREGRKHGIRVSVAVRGAPAWANGGHDWNWAPRRMRDLHLFMKAAVRRYPGVRYWMVWIEPTRRHNFMPLEPETRDKPLGPNQRRGPQRYARMVDTAYAAVKSVDRGDKVIGGNSFVTGDVSPKNWVRFVKLPNGRPPRMDMWGHNPFGYRKPDLSDPPLGHGFVDFGTLDTLAKWLDRHQRRGGRRLPLFLSEYTIPSDHQNHEFNFWATRETQAEFATAALRATRSWKRIHTLGWFQLLDEPPNGPGGTHGDENHRGLMTYDRLKKPSYRAFRRG